MILNVLACAAVAVLILLGFSAVAACMLSAKISHEEDEEELKRWLDSRDEL